MKLDRFIALFLLAGVSAGVSACGEAGRQTAAEVDLEAVDPSGQKIVFWHQYRSVREKAINAMIEEFNGSNHHGIEVKGDYIGNYSAIYTKMLVGLQGGYLPQLVLAYNYQAEAYHQAGGVVDLTPYMESLKWGLSARDRADYNEDFLQQDNIQGAQVALLPHRSMEILFYNQSWLQELGYDEPPKSWDAFVEMCRRATKQPFSGSADASYSKGFLLNIDASRLAAMVFSRGGDFVNADRSAYTFKTREAQASLELLHDLRGEGAMDLLAADNKAAFGAGQVLFAIHSSSRLPFFISSVESGADFAWNVTVLPYTGDDPVQNVYGGSFSVCKTTLEQQVAAWLFIKWFTQPFQQERWVRRSNYFPVRESTARALVDFYGTAYHLLEYGKPEPSKIGYESVRGMVEQAMAEAVEGGDIGQILTKLDSEANKTL